MGVHRYRGDLSTSPKKSWKQNLTKHQKTGAMALVSHCLLKGPQFNHFPGLKCSSPTSIMGITTPAGIHFLVDSGRKQREDRH